MNWFGFAELSGLTIFHSTKDLTNKTSCSNLAVSEVPKSLILKLKSESCIKLRVDFTSTLVLAFLGIVVVLPALKIISLSFVLNDVTDFL